MQWFLLITLLTAGLTFTRGNDVDIPEEVGEIADQIPGLKDIDKSQIPSVENAEKIFKEKCAKYGGEGAYDHANEAKEHLIECVKNQVNVTVLKEEIEQSKPTGDLDTVFGKYCKKTPTVMGCLKDFTAAVDPCLDEKEKENKVMIINMTESLVNFLCHKDGDRIAMFIAEGGIECLSDKQEAVQACVNSTFGKKIPTEMPDIDNLPLLVIKEEQCNDLTLLQECVVTELEKCKEPTPANIMESLFKFIRRVTPCDKLGKKDSAKLKNTNSSSASSILSSVFLVLGAVLLKFA